MTALAEVATYLPEQRIPIEAMADRLGLSPIQVRLFRRYHELAEVSMAPDTALPELLLAAVDNLATLPGREHRVKYVLHARSFGGIAPYPANPLHDLCRQRGLDHAVTFAVHDHACASGLLAIDLAGRLLANDDPDALALVLTGEKAFTPEMQLIPETTIFGEGAAACLVSAAGPRDRLVAYAVDIRGDFDEALSEDPAHYQHEYPVVLADTVLAAIESAGLSRDDIDVILPHNVNTLVWRKLCRRIGYPTERVLLENVSALGHVFCADAFVNYQSARKHGLLRPGGHYLVAAAGLGRGATFSAMVFTH